MINVTQIFKLAGLTLHQRTYRIKALTMVQQFPAYGTHGPKNTWVNLQQGRTLCREFGLEEKLQPLLDHGLNLDTENDDNTGRENVLQPQISQPPFIEISCNSHRLMVRRSDWRINYTHIANQIAGKHMIPKMKQCLPDNVDELVRGPYKYQGTYVDFDYGVEMCNRYSLFQLADQLLELRHTENERTVAPIPQTSMNECHAVSVSPRVAASNHVLLPTVAGYSDTQDSYEPEDLIIMDDEKAAKSEDTEEDDDSLEEEDTLSVGTDVTQLYDPQSNGLGDEALPRQSNDHDIEPGYEQRMEEKTSYYSYRDFEPRNSDLEEVQLCLQAPSKTSSRYGSMTDASHSFWLAPLDT